jgi:hypothetical protein
MNADAGALIVTLIGLGTPAVLFLRRVIPLQSERPELLQNGLWFMLPFLLLPLTALFTLILVPVALVIVIVLRGGAKGPLFSVALGELSAAVFGAVMLFVLNTFFVPRH